MIVIGVPNTCVMDIGQKQPEVWGSMVALNKLGKEIISQKRNHSHNKRNSTHRYGFRL